MSDLGNKEIFAKNLKYYMQLNNKDRNDICHDLKFPYTTFAEWYNGKIYPRIDKIEMLANYFNIKKSDLIERKDSEDDFKKIGAIPLSDIETTKIPVLGKVKAGYNYLAQENIIDHIAFNIDGADKENYYALYVIGDSMEPLFDDGDIVIVHKQDDFNNGDNCVVLINGDEATIKKVCKGTTGIELKAVNPYYPPRIFTEEEIRDLPVKVIGVVEKSIRNFKKKQK